MDDADKHTVEEYLAVWADLVSLLLLCFAILSQGGIDPRRRVWGYSSPRNALILFSMALNILFSAARFIAEGVLVETGPREFLLLSVIYAARWLWLFAAITKADSRAAKAFEVARELRRLKTIRLGTSTSPTRRGAPELVIRRGARTASGKTTYWRGVEEYVKQCGSHYKVRLVQKELHSGQLDELGTVLFKRRLETEDEDALYKKFYDLVLTVDREDDNLIVDYSEFLQTYQPVILPSTRLPQRVGATSDSIVGNVARRVAADACYYIWNKNAELRTAKQVDLINSSIERAAHEFLRSDDDMGLDDMGRSDSPGDDTNNDIIQCDCFGIRTITESPV